MVTQASRTKAVAVLVQFATFGSMPIDQHTLRGLWHAAPVGRLSPWETAKALGLREASKELHGGTGNLPWIAARLSKVGGGHPGAPALCELFAKVDADPDWFPGKHNGAKRGPKPLLTHAKRRCIAQSAMTAKRKHGQEPCIAAVVHACPLSTTNPQTNLPFCDKTIRKVFTEDCYDFDPEHPWKFQHALQKIFLPASVKALRLPMAKYLLRHSPEPHWWFQHVVWFDPCASIIPGSQKQYDQMRQTLKGRKRYISDNAKQYSPNLLGPPTALKQKQWEGTRINWFMVLTRGVMHVEVLPQGWTLKGRGLAIFVERLQSILRKMLGPDARLPRTVFTDRGTGMYNPIGKVVNDYADAMDKEGFKLYWGRDAHRQSPDMGDVLLHETAVSWFRKLMRQEKPEVLPWEETQEQWAKRARKVVATANRNYDVAGLCHEFPTRLRDVIDREGDRLPK